MSTLVKKSIILTFLIFVPMLLTNMVLSNLQKPQDKFDTTLIFIGVALVPIIIYLFWNRNILKKN